MISPYLFSMELVICWWTWCQFFVNIGSCSNKTISNTFPLFRNSIYCNVHWKVKVIILFPRLSGWLCNKYLKQFLPFISKITSSHRPWTFARLLSFRGSLKSKSGGRSDTSRIKTSSSSGPQLWGLSLLLVPGWASVEGSASVEGLV